MSASRERAQQERTTIGDAAHGKGFIFERRTMTYELPSDDITLDEMFDPLHHMGFTESRAHLIIADVLDGIAADMRFAASTRTNFTYTADDRQERLTNAIIKAMDQMPESEFADLKDL